MSKKIAIVYDWLDKWGGVERVLLIIHKMFPQADFFTSYYDRQAAAWAKNIKIKSSFLQRFPSLIRKSRLASFLFYPFAFEALDFSGYDLVFSVTSSFAKGIVTKPGTKHICYLLTPTRYLWVCPEDYFSNKLIRRLITPVLGQTKHWDYKAAQRPDKIISISQTVADRCQRYYQRQSEVIYPPFDVEYWKKTNSKLKTPAFAKATAGKLHFSLDRARDWRGKQNFFLVVSRLEPYKRVDLVIDTFNHLLSSSVANKNSQSLIVVGDGSQEKKLRQMAANNVYFYKNLSDEELGYLYSKSQGLIMPQEEDFGYVSLEAQFFGCPVIAYRKGGAVETVIEGKTGIFFEKQSLQSLGSALERFDDISYNLRCATKKLGQDNIRKFDIREFIRKMKEEI